MTFARGPISFIMLAVMAIIWIATVLAALGVAALFLWIIGSPKTSTWLEPKAGPAKTETLDTMQHNWD